MTEEKTPPSVPAMEREALARAAYGAIDGWSCDPWDAAEERRLRLGTAYSRDQLTALAVADAILALPSKAPVKGEEETLLKWQKEYGHYDYEPSWAKTPFGEYRAEYMENSGGTKWHVRLAYCTGNFGTTYDPQLHFPTREEAQEACEKDFANRLRPYIAALVRPSDNAPQDSGEGQEPKYRFDGGRVYNRASGEVIPLDEPVMVFRARDRHAVSVIEYYAALVGSGDADHVEAVHRRHEDFAAFVRNHPDRMKEPDTEPLPPSPSSQGK